MNQSLQERYAPELRCFGCGPANEQGLRIRSLVDGDDVVCTWQASEHHQAFPGMMNGGIIGTLLDCHLNWAAAWHLMQKHGHDRPPCTVTAEYSVTLKRPTPLDGPVTLRARAVESGKRSATIEGTLESNGKVTAIGRGVFVAVQEGHPAFHRW